MLQKLFSYFINYSDGIQGNEEVLERRDEGNDGIRE